MGTIEGFTADSELLGQAVGEAPEYDMDNCYTFEFKGQDALKIPEMKFEDLENILIKDMKLRKACDINKLTVEHLSWPVATLPS